MPYHVHPHVRWGEMGGYKWATGFASRVVFGGLYQNGTKDQLRKALQAAISNYQRVIDLQHVKSGPQTAHAVFSDMLRMAGAHALVFVDSILPLADMLGTTGMSEPRPGSGHRSSQRRCSNPSGWCAPTSSSSRTRGEPCCGGRYIPPCS